MTEKNKKLFIIITLHAGFLLPFIARIPGIFLYGGDFFMQYLDNAALIFLISSLNSAPYFVLAILINLLEGSKNTAVLSAYLATLSMTLYIHGTLDIVHGTVAGTAFLFVPLFILIFLAVGFVAGLAVEKIAAALARR